MKITNTRHMFLAGASAITLALAMVTPALADSDLSLKASLAGQLGITHASFVATHQDRDDDRGEQDKKDNEKHDKKDKNATTTANGMVNVAGTVSAMTGSTITLVGNDGVAYTVNASQATIAGSENNSLTLSNVQVGDTVRVRGALSGSTITAKSIVDATLRANLFLRAIGAVGAGIVSSVNGATFTIKSLGHKNATTTVTTNASTTYRVNGVATTSSALSVGSRVVLNGTSTGIDSMSASVVTIFNFGSHFFKNFFFR